MKFPLASIGLLALCSCSAVLALDKACEPLIKSSEAKIAQSAWRSVSPAGEAIKTADKSYMQMEGKWIESPLDLNEIERQVIENVKTGTLKVTDCKETGSEVLDGKEMRIFMYTTEIPNSGFPASTAKLYIGKEDGLPYLQTGIDDQETTKVTYHYIDITAPL